MTTNLQRIAIVTDSAACVPEALRQEYDIRVVPYRLIWNGATYLDGRDLTPAEFYQRFRTCKTYPTTAQPSLSDFLDVYRDLLDYYEGIVSIHVAERLTTALQVARLAAREVGQERIRLVDSHTAASSEAFVVLAAARTAAKGASLEDVVAAAQECTTRVGMVFTMETLEHLHRGGRIGQAATLLGTRLHIQPVLTLIEGQVRPVTIRRQRDQAKAQMFVELERRTRGNPLRAAVFHADVPEEAQELLEAIRARFTCVESFISEFTPVMGAHTGPGIIGIGYCIEKGEAVGQKGE